MSQPDMEYPCQSFNLKGDGGKEVIKLAASIVCLTKAGPKDTETTESIILDEVEEAPEEETNIDNNIV